MMMKHIKDQSDNEQKMKDDNFEVTNKQTDPDYETIHFNRGQSIKRSKTQIERIDADEDLDEIETASVLDFSSKKRELVIGIDRKPEIKPLSVFKLSDTSGSAMSSLESVSLSPDTANERSIKMMIMFWNRGILFKE